MTRLGQWMLIGFIAIIGIFFVVVRRGNVPADAPSSPVAQGEPGAGGLVLPVRGVAAAQLGDTWGQSRGGGAREHHAIDIPAPRGTPVIAAAAGTVEKLFESGDGGHTIYIRRADPAWVDYYAHLDGYAPDLREGVAVRQGQVIAAVGSTGSAIESAPHLHYEVKRMSAGEKWYQGKNVNPYPILAGKADGG